MSASSVDVVKVSEAAASESRPKRDLKFWLIIVSLCVSLFCSALDFTGVATALPTIVHDLNGADFAWVGTSYAISATALLPFNGGLSEIFGRRLMMLITLALFALGSALCGAAQSMEWLIAARVVQGLGGGGLISVPNIIVSDLVPLHERGAFVSILGLSWALASALGPLIGGALANAGQWRWFFYMNLPISGLAFVAVFIFVKLPIPSGTLQEKLARIDWGGNAIVVASTTSVVIGLTWGGVNFAWSSFHVLVPLILGAVGFVAFLLYEGFVPKRPVVAWSLLNNITSISGYLQTFLHPIITVACIYYLATYYQACKDASAMRSAVLILTLALVSTPALITMGLSVNKLQVYRPQLWLAWVVYLAGIGSLIAVDADSHVALPVGLTCLVAFGSGIIYGGTFYPILSPLPVTENAYAISFLYFCRSFAGVWGIAIGGAILQNQLAKKLPAEFIANIQAQTGSASVELTYSVIPLIRDLPEPLKSEVRHAFGESISLIWKVMTAICGAGFLVSLLMRDVPMHTKTDQRWALEEMNRNTSSLEQADPDLESPSKEMSSPTSTDHLK
ncbi:hypothetical protein EIP91_002645 [Steccherinum ochraceum]|uniref:Major facilitator superfamily (MFS) profile domain-containing protein n=1 Tax=Steccherinum ochraceum TaxID=92696 RepID=A0A4R0RVA9_9APHY|nr:hypothetical protein EIP91_002645 [Steccherinum ochraceum]